MVSTTCADNCEMNRIPWGSDLAIYGINTLPPYDEYSSIIVSATFSTS